MLALMRLNDPARSLELIARLDANAVREIALLDSLRADEQLVHGGRDRADQQAAHDERRRLNDQQQPAEHDEQVHEERPPVVAAGERHGAFGSNLRRPDGRQARRELGDRRFEPNRQPARPNHRSSSGSP